MKKIFTALLMSLFLIMSASSFADCCGKFFGGTFVGVRSNVSPAILDQYIFNADGTAIWNQSTALDHPITTGTFSISLGTWKFDGKCHIEATFIDATATPTTSGPA